MGVSDTKIDLKELGPEEMAELVKAGQNQERLDVIAKKILHDYTRSHTEIRELFEKLSGKKDKKLISLPDSFKSSEILKPFSPDFKFSTPTKTFNCRSVSVDMEPEFFPLKPDKLPVPLKTSAPASTGKFLSSEYHSFKVKSDEDCFKDFVTETAKGIKIKEEAELVEAIKKETRLVEEIKEDSKDDDGVSFENIEEFRDWFQNARS